MGKGTRRTFLKASTAGVAAAVVPKTAQALIATPGATEGPYYPAPAMRFDDADNNLVRVEGKVRDAGGEIIHMTGQVTDGDGNPVSGARVEIWQCDANGRYLHTSDNRNTPRDNGFQGFGHDVTGKDGTYRFRTIRPVPYPGRTPHIHVKVFTAKRTLTTQIYLAGEPGNQRDPLYRRLSAAERQAVAMRFEKRDGVPTTTVNLVV